MMELEFTQIIKLTHLILLRYEFRYPNCRYWDLTISPFIKIVAQKLIKIYDYDYILRMYLFKKVLKFRFSLREMVLTLYLFSNFRKSFDNSIRLPFYLSLNSMIFAYVNRWGNHSLKVKILCTLFTYRIIFYSE